MPKEYDKNSQLAEEIAHNVSEFLSERLSEKYGIVTCTHINLTHDQHSATAYISFYPELKNKDIKKLINPIRHDLVEHIRQRVPMRYIPKITFSLDVSGKYASNIDKIMENL